MKGGTPICFPDHLQDTDLSFTVRRLGFRVKYMPFARVRHEESSTYDHATDLKALKDRLMAQSRYRFSLKWQRQLTCHMPHSDVWSQRQAYIPARRLYMLRVLVLAPPKLLSFLPGLVYPLAGPLSYPVGAEMAKGGLDIWLGAKYAASARLVLLLQGMLAMRMHVTLAFDSEDTGVARAAGTKGLQFMGVEVVKFNEVTLP